MVKMVSIINEFLKLNYGQLWSDDFQSNHRVSSDDIEWGN